MSSHTSKLQDSILESVQKGPSKPELAAENAFLEAEGELPIEEKMLDEVLEDIKPVAKIKKRKGKTTSVLPILAIVIAVASGVGGSISSYFDNQKIQEIVETVTSMDEQAELTLSQVDSLNLLIQKIQTNASFERASLEELKTAIPDVDVIKSKLEGLKSEMLSMRDVDNNHQMSIISNKSKVINVEKRVEQLESQPKIQTIQKKQVKTIKIKNETNSVEGASLAALDTWGVDTYVMLLEPNGNWVALKKGDYYKGWKFSHTKDELAVFKNRKQQRSLRVEG